ncbi:MAG: hypothetical protein MI919_25440, partial [Holophagales bacterium]|nr:hypothetical protein [Holophagales bacterium]
KDRDLIAVALESFLIRGPAPLQGLVRIVEEIHIIRETWSARQLVESRPAGDIAFSGRDPEIR